VGASPIEAFGRAWRRGADSRMEETESNSIGAWRDALVRRLGEAGCGRDSGCIGTLDLLARAGLPVPEGVILTRQAHEEFLRLRRPETSADEPRRYGSLPPRAPWKES
jgi:hypothetical protein